MNNEVPKSESPAKRPWTTIGRLLVIIPATVLPLLFFPALLALCIPFISFLAHLLLGWLNYVRRTFPRIEVNWQIIGMSLVLVLLTLAVAHQCFAWLWNNWGKSTPAGPDQSSPPNRWQRKWTLMIISGILLLFSLGTCALGIVHQVWWISSSQDPVFQSPGELRDETGRRVEVRLFRWEKPPRE